MMMCLGVFLFGSNFFGTLWASWTSWKSVSFVILEKFSFIICSNKFSISCSCSSLSGTPIFQILECLKLSQRFLSFSSFFGILVSSFCSTWMIISSFLFQIVDLSPGFLPVTVGTLNILLYFILGIFHLGPISLSQLTGQVGLVNCFFNSLVVRVPRSLIFGHFWLFIDFRLVATLLLVVRGSEGFLLTPPSWLELNTITVVY